MTILASFMLASMTQLPLASSPAATAPATTDLRPLPAQTSADAGATSGAFTVVNDLRDPFGHVPRVAPPRPSAPPNDLKDPFAVQRAPGGAPAPVVDPTFIDPFVHRDDRVEVSVEAPSPLKDPFVPAPRPAPTSVEAAPSPRPPPIQRPTLAPRRV